MKSIKVFNKNLILFVSVFIVLLIISLFMYRTLKVIQTRTDQIVKKDLLSEARVTNDNLIIFLKGNRDLFDKTFMGAAENRFELSSFCNQYISLASKKHIKSIYFVTSDKKVIFLYPDTSDVYIPINILKNPQTINKNIEIARREGRSMYFNSTILDKNFNRTMGLMLIKPIFSSSAVYLGSIVENIDLQTKLSDIFLYLKDYSVTVGSVKPKERETNSSVSVVLPVNIDKANFYIKIRRACDLKNAVFKNIKSVILNLLLLIIISFVVLISAIVILAQKEKREKQQRRALQKINKRIKMVEETTDIQEEHTSENNIKKLLTMINDVFEGDLSGVFLKDSKMNYTFNGQNIRSEDYMSMKGSASAYVWNKKKDIMINDFKKAQFIDDNIKKRTNVKSSICALIFFKKHYYGVVCAGSSKKANAFKQEDFNFLKLIAHNVAANIYYSSLSKNITETLLNAIEARDSYTEGHSRRVGEYARFISKILGFDEEFQRNMLVAGLFHDVGKVGIPDIILLKPTRLSPNEYEIMKMHSVFSYEILKDAEALQPVIKGIRGHHERWDGKGYPDGLKAEDIPISARILATADSFDAITTSRPYKSAMLLAQTKKELLNNASSQFDPEIIEKIMPHIEKMYNLGKSLRLDKQHLFPESIENARKNIFYTDWFTGLTTMDRLENRIMELIVQNIEFSLCRIDIVSFVTIKYKLKLGKKEASEVILKMAGILRKNIGEDVARTSEDVFTFVVKGTQNPFEFINEVSSEIESKLKLPIRSAYASYPEDGDNTNELMYRLSIRWKESICEFESE